MSGLYTLSLRGDGSVTLGDDPIARLELAVGAIQTIAAADEGATLAMPGGFLRAVSPVERDAWAERLVEGSREHGVGLLFGMDIEFTLEEEYHGGRHPRSFAYAIDRGRRALWASVPASGNWREQLQERAVEICGRRIVVLLQSDLFRPAARWIVQQARPELTMLLAHGEPTPRWKPAMQALDSLAPLIVVNEEDVKKRRTWSLPPRGWQSHALVANAFVTLHRFTVDETAKQPAVSG